MLQAIANYPVRTIGSAWPHEAIAVKHGGTLLAMSAVSTTFCVIIDISGIASCM